MARIRPDRWFLRRENRIPGLRLLNKYVLGKHKIKTSIRRVRRFLEVFGSGFQKFLDHTGNKNIETKPVFLKILQRSRYLVPISN
jgi:hypothetical protein